MEKKNNTVPGIQPHHFMANKWGNNGNSDRFCFLGSKITANGDCSREIKRRLLLERKAMTNLDSVCKAETSLCCNGLYNQSYDFPSSHVQR